MHSIKAIEVTLKSGVPCTSEAPLTLTLTPTPTPTPIHVPALSEVSVEERQSYLMANNSNSSISPDIAAVHVSPRTTTITAARDDEEVGRHTFADSADCHGDGIRESEVDEDFSSSSSPLLEELLEDLQAVRSTLSLKEQQFAEEFGESCYRAIRNNLESVQCNTLDYMSL